jgi:6-phosphogluconolactonase
MPVVPLLIGTYTGALGHVEGRGEGILGTTLDTGTGVFGPTTLLARTRNPSYLALSASGAVLYACDESADPDGAGGGAVTAFARDTATGALQELGSRPAGAGACHVAVAPSGRYVLVASYHSGSVQVFPVAPDGSLGEPTHVVRHHGSSVHPVRQTGAHAHMVAFDPRTGEVLVPDLGMDAVVVYALSPDGRLQERARIDAVPGDGPRHLVFHPDGDRVYVLGELGNTVLAARRDGDRWQRTAVASTLPAGFTGHSQAGAIRISPSGRHLLASNRGHDSVAVLRVDGDDVALVRTEPVRGRWPRELTLLPDGRTVLAGNQDEGGITAFAFDDDTATLVPLGDLRTPHPVCVLPLR